MKKILFISLVFSGLMAFSQQKGANASWENSRFNFGDIKEDGGNVFHKFEFTNTGDQPLVITNVHASCGCTSSDYTKAPIMPGKKGYVEASFNPKYRPGKFTKTLSVTTNAQNPNTILYLMGNVLPRTKTKAELYPRQIGDLRLKTNHLAFGNIKNNELKTDSVPMANLTEKNLKITFDNLPKHAKVKAIPETLKPQQTGYIQVTYDAKQKNDWGFVMDRINFAINGDKNRGANYFSVSASVIEDFQQLSPKELEKAPKIVFESRTFNFGNIKEGEKITHTFNFKNEGKSDLIIRKIKSSCGCAAVNLASDVIKSGKSGAFELTFDSRGKKNRQNKTVSIITNDPKNSQITLRISGNVTPMQ